MKARTIVKTYNKNSVADMAVRKLDEAYFSARGYHVESVEDVKEYSGSKGCCLFLIFAPLAFFGFKKKIRVVYANNEQQ